MVDPGEMEICLPDDDFIVGGKVEGAAENDTQNFNLKGQVESRINEILSAFGLCQFITS